MIDLGVYMVGVLLQVSLLVLIILIIVALSMPILLISSIVCLIYYIIRKYERGKL